MPLRPLTPQEQDVLRQQGVDPSGMQIDTDLAEQQSGQSNGVSQGQAVGRTLKAHAGGITGGGAGAIGGASIGALFGPADPVTIPIGAIAGGIIGSIGGGYAGQKIQDTVLSPETTAALQQQYEEAAKQHPYTTLGTDIVSSALASGGRPSMDAIRGARGVIGSLGGRAMTDAERAAAINAGAQGVINPAINTGIGLATTGQMPSGSDLAAQAAGGALFSKSWVPSGKNVGTIEEAPIAGETTTEPADTVITTPWTEQSTDGQYKINNANVKKSYIEQNVIPIPKDADYITKAQIRTANDSVRSNNDYDSMRDWLHQKELAKQQEAPSTSTEEQMIHGDSSEAPDAITNPTIVQPDASGLDSANKYTAPNDDYNRYQELQIQMRNLGVKQSDTPEFKQLWSEVESIKNKYGGNPPVGPSISTAERAKTPDAVREHIQSGTATTGSVLQTLASSKHPYSTLVKGILDGADTQSLGARWNYDPELDLNKDSMRSHYSVGQDQVNIGTLHSGNADTIIEEALHSLTSKKLSMFVETGKAHYAELNNYLAKGKDENIKDLIHAYFETAKHTGNFTKLFEGEVTPEGRYSKATAGNPDLAYGKGVPYALGSLDEFVAHAFKNREFQTVLNKIKTQDNRTVWQHIVDSVRKLFNLNVEQGSMLDRVLRSSSELISTKREEGLAGRDSVVSKAPEQEQVTSKTLGKLGKTFGSVLDNVRAIHNSGAKVLADAYQRALDKKQQLTGRYLNKSVDSGKGLTASDKTALQKAIDDFRVLKKEPAGLSAKAQQWFDTNRQLIKQFGAEHIASNVPIKTANGGMRLMKQDPNHWPTMAKQQVEELFRQGDDVEGMKKHQQEFEKYYINKLGYNPVAAKQAFQEWKDSITGKATNTNISNQDYFNAVRKAQGEPLPPTFREQDPVKNMARYFDRASTALAHYTEVEANHPAMAALGNTHDAWLRPIAPNEDGSIANNKYVRSAIQQFISIPKGVAEHTEESISGLTTALFISSPGLEVHKLGSNFVKSTLYAPNPYVAVRAVSRAIIGMREGWQHAKEGGLVKLTANSSKDMLDTTLTTYQRMSGAAKLVRDISTLGGMTTKANAAYQQAYFENLLPSIINRANKGNVDSARLLKHWDADWQKGKEYTQQDVQKLASTAASYVHGTGDIRQMPAWMMNESEISGFMQLAHWSTAQTNNFLHDVWLPAKRGNYMPLLTGMFGAAVGGYIIKELREDIQGKKGQIPSLGEIAASDRGLEGNGGLLMYNAIAAMQYAGFGGLFSQVAKYPFDFIYKNKPQGATFPLDEIASDILGTASHVATTLANDPNVNYVDLASMVSQHILRSDIKIASIAINQGINHGLITGQPADQKALSDKLGELRRFNEAEGLPYQEMDAASNPYMNLEQKNFKRTQDVGEAMKMLPSLVSNIVQTYGDKPDVMMSKLKALKENQYDTFPSMEGAPLSFYKYLGYLQRYEGAGEAQSALQDYLRHKTINEVKASAVP